MRNQAAAIALLACAHFTASGATVTVDFDGREATGVYSAGGEPPVAFDGKFKSDAKDVRISLKSAETRMPGEKFKTWRPDSFLASHGAFAAAAGSGGTASPPPPPGAWPDDAGFPGDVPRPYWRGHEDAVECYYHAWAVVGRENIRAPEPGSGFVRNFVYTPFGSSVFMWGTGFITMYGRYASHIFPFIEMLDNFYVHQDSDGFIPRQIDVKTGESAFEKNDLSSCGGDILSWAEWRNYEWTRDRERLRKVYPSLLAFHRWLRRHRTWKDGSYFSSGWGCGMDNVPRIEEPPYNHAFDHGHLSFVDFTLQQMADAKYLLEIASVAGETEGVSELRAEYERLFMLANDKMWDGGKGVYMDLDRDSNRLGVQHAGTFWGLLSGAADAEKTGRLAQAAFDPERFAAACGIASTARCEPGFVADGGNYWAGGCWCIMDYTAAKGFEARGRRDVAHRIARRAVESVAKVYAETGAIWESYSPSAVEPGKNWGHRVRKFVGFSGVVPIALFIENVIGVNVVRGEDGAVAVEWDVRLTEPHGIENFVLPDGRRVNLRFDGENATMDGAEGVDFHVGRSRAGYVVSPSKGGSR